MDLGTSNRRSYETWPLTADLSIAEETRLAEQVRLDALKSPAERNILGQFATPPHLARDIACLAADLLAGRMDRIRFLEPAVGSGCFYSALLHVIDHEQLESAKGIEMDPEFSKIADTIWRPFGLEVYGADFTMLEPPTLEKDKANLIIANPPYVRHHHLSRDDKIRLKSKLISQLGLNISGLAGLYCYFLLLSDAWLASEGLGIWLIPTEFMEVNYGSTVRQYLTDRVTLVRVHVFDRNEVQFHDALVSSAVVVLQKKRPKASHKVVLSTGSSLKNPETTTSIPIKTLNKARKWTNLLTDPKATQTGIEGQVTLRDLFIIKRGLATGANRFFILSRSEAAAKEIPEQFLKPILPSPRYLSSTTIEADSDGYPDLPDQKCLIDCDLPEFILEEKFPALAAYLQQGKSAGVHLGYLASRRTPWYRQEYRAPAPYLCTYMGRTSNNSRKLFRFIWNKSRALATNVYLLLYPKAFLADAFNRCEPLRSVIHDLLQNIDDSTLEHEGRAYGGGLQKLEPGELGRVPAEAIWETIREFTSISSLIQPTLFNND